VTSGATARQCGHARSVPRPQLWCDARGVTPGWRGRFSCAACMDPCALRQPRAPSVRRCPGRRGARERARTVPPSAEATPGWDCARAHAISCALCPVRARPQEAKEPPSEEAPRPPAAAYSADAFFDELSCEAIERLSLAGAPPRPQPRFAEMRRVDAETFGGSGIARRAHGGRGRRGGRGRVRAAPACPSPACGRRGRARACRSCQAHARPGRACLVGRGPMRMRAGAPTAVSAMRVWGANQASHVCWLA